MKTLEGLKIGRKLRDSVFERRELKLIRTSNMAIFCGAASMLVAAVAKNHSLTGLRVQDVIFGEWKNSQKVE